MLRIDPNYLAARIELAQLLLANRGAQSALQLLDETPQDQRETVSVVVQRNWALLALGQKAEARKGIDRSASYRQSSRSAGAGRSSEARPEGLFRGTDVGRGALSAGIRKRFGL